MLDTVCLSFTTLVSPLSKSKLESIWPPVEKSHETDEFKGTKIEPQLEIESCLELDAYPEGVGTSR